MNRTNVIITIDTETFAGDALPIGPAIYGEIDGKRYGVEKIMDICETHGARATFFVDVLEHHLFGKSAMARLCRDIDGRTHDVQLHVHPNNVPGCTHKFLSAYRPGIQADMIREGRDLIAEWTGKTPCAFRAGSYAASVATIEALELNGFKVDSSYFALHRNCALSRQLNHPYRNAVFSINGVTEIPVTVYRLMDIPWYGHYSKIDIDACSREEICHVIDQLAGKTDVLILFLHSFSFMSWTADGRHLRPDRGDMDNFAAVLAFLSRREDVHIVTVNEYYRAAVSRKMLPRTADFIPCSSLLLNINRLTKRYMHH